MVAAERQSGILFATSSSESEVVVIRQLAIDS